MINKSTKLLGVMIVLIGLLSSCTLANTEKQVSAGTGDQLVGAFVTTEEIGKEYKDRVKGELILDEDEAPESINFEGVDGIGCYTLMGDMEHGPLMFFSDDGFSEVNNMAGGVSAVEATMYADMPTETGALIYPVYQTLEGEIYLSTTYIEYLREIFHDDGKAGVTMNNKSSSKLGNKDGIRSVEFLIWVGQMPRVKTVTARQYDEKGTLLISQPVEPEKLAKGDMTLKRVANMSYATVEWDMGKGKSHSITEKYDEGLVATAYAHNPKGIAIERSIYFK